MWRYFSIFITLMASSFAQASDWIVLSPPTSEKRGILQLDKESIQREGALVKAWTRAVYYKPVAVPGSEPLTSRVVASLNFVNCKERTLAKQIIVYLSDGEHPVEISKKGPFPAESVIPDTTNELILKTVCRGHQEKPTLPKQDLELPHQVQQSNV